MKTTFLIVLNACAIFFVLPDLQAQCAFTPTVTGNLILCPDAGDTLETQQFQAYQWYKREYGASNAQPISGATGRKLPVSTNDAPAYFSVAATLDGCTETSAEVLLDGWAFLPPVVATLGEGSIGPEGEVLLCPGDTAVLQLLLPYTENIQWVRNNIPIAGATDDSLLVTQPGFYTVSGAPVVCPDFIQPLGLLLEFQWRNPAECLSSIKQPEPLTGVKIAPNPAQALVNIQVAEPGETMLEMFDLAGRRILQQSFENNTQLQTGELPRGLYLLQLLNGTKQDVQRIMLY